MHQSSSTRKQQKEESTLQTNLLYLKITTTKLLLKLKTKTEKWLPIKKYADLTTKEKNLVPFIY
jgi:hypothetical protein